MINCSRWGEVRGMWGKEKAQAVYSGLIYVDETIFIRLEIVNHFQQ